VPQPQAQGGGGRAPTQEGCATAGSAGGAEGWLLRSDAATHCGHLAAVGGGTWRCAWVPPCLLAPAPTCTLPHDTPPCSHLHAAPRHYAAHDTSTDPKSGATHHAHAMSTTAITTTIAAATTSKTPRCPPSAPPAGGTAARGCGRAPQHAAQRGGPGPDARGHAAHAAGRGAAAVQGGGGGMEPRQGACGPQGAARSAGGARGGATAIFRPELAAVGP